MSWPGWVRSVNSCIFVVEPLLDEVKTDSQRTSSGEGLARDNSLGLHCFMVCTISQLNAMLVVSGDTVDASVLVIHILLQNFLLGLLNTSQDQWFTVIVSVGSHTKEYLLWVSVLLESIVQTEDGIWRSGVDLTPKGVASSKGSYWLLDECWIALYK